HTRPGDDSDVRKSPGLDARIRHQPRDRLAQLPYGRAHRGRRRARAPAFHLPNAEESAPRALPGEPGLRPCTRARSRTRTGPLPGADLPRRTRAPGTNPGLREYWHVAVPHGPETHPGAERARRAPIVPQNAGSATRIAA